ncbi:hypothetical protein BKA82DRAFT_1003742 [Pisolithus tinctorius]|uniref:Uncharacterized protein n=1 Tax=Pisolithus tinctorius Marx 270 TaxID=870435 RepID=A0A0C3IV38_PISTI|nr:hypothetical protein BKA82DRAFT_1003742 [Pisolithus tinctorius]KIO00728.1 hypothetical protein M404DRAFT_1003742 [Pisolithus tinctorius Marx 270]
MTGIWRGLQRPSAAIVRWLAVTGTRGDRGSPYHSYPINPYLLRALAAATTLLHHTALASAMGWFYDPKTEPLLPIYKRGWFQILIACISLVFLLISIILLCTRKSPRSLPKERSTKMLPQPPRSVIQARVIRNVQPTPVDGNGSHLNPFYTPAAYPKEIFPMYNGSGNPPPPPYTEPGWNADDPLRHPYQASREDLRTPPLAYRGFHNSQ